jgi:glycosyltransferase involved in cell wall biosynthesis/peptidoglycan/xylan/chitin deacetylase (PgdA/CDA1 family)
MHHHIKKAVPRGFQIALRSMVVMYKWAKLGSAWPTYDPVIPVGWSGWPDGRKFALVLTHDVDSAKGCRKWGKVADIEEGLGFRSSFNFVVDDYYVSPEIREELNRRGFEVGVHGLHHNSSLYHSRTEFLSQSVRINQVLREWNSVGFRSPCMYHNLEWLKHLDIEYDSSTFDIDPFEPQPDGMHTLFPFLVRNGSGDRTYVELPYTLPQDFTVFILMRNRNIDIWKEKLDWVVRYGGMALVLTHPDYMSFGGEPAREEYPASHYKELLEYVQDRYKGLYWNVLPRDMARFCSGPDSRGKISREKGRKAKAKTPARAKVQPEVEQTRPKGPGETPPVGHRAPRRVCMLAYSFYEQDNRVRRYAEALAKRGDLVDAIALKHGDLPSLEIINGVNVYRIQERTRNETGKESYLSRLLKFLFNSALFLSEKHLDSRYDLVHVHSVPDFEVFAALLPRLTGAKIILDIHDLVPEFYASKFGVDRNSLPCKALEFTEKASIRFSDHVIISNHLWEKKLTQRSVPRSKCSTFLNCPDPSIFHRRSAPKTGDEFIMIYPGSLNWHQGVDIAIKALDLARHELPEAQFQIYGEGPEELSLRNLVSELELEKQVLFNGSVPLDSIPEAMSHASVGVVPKRNDSFGGEAFSTKVFEFMALGVPIILSRTVIDRFYFDDSVVRFFEPENYLDLAESMVFLAKNAQVRQQLASNALAFVDGFSWDKRKQDYFRLVDSLLSTRSREDANRFYHEGHEEHEEK